MRQLSPEEAALWAKVTDTIRPLSRDLPVPSVAQARAPTVRPGDETVAVPARVKGRVPPPRPLPPPVSRPAPSDNLDGHWDRRLRQGEIVPDRTLDLHGHGLDSAWEAIDRTLERAIAAGDRVILLITGHRREGAPPIERGRIRAAVGHWLEASRHRTSIAAVRGAHRRHGGGGSLYVILRRPR